MKRISITSLQRNPGELSTTLIRGEEVVLTRNGKDLAQLIPLNVKRRLKPKPKETFHLNTPAPIFGTNIQMRSPKPQGELRRRELLKAVGVGHIPEKYPETFLATHRCEAPNTDCRFPGEPYIVVYQGEEGLIEKKVMLCPGHAQKAKETAESMVKV